MVKNELQLLMEYAEEITHKLGNGIKKDDYYIEDMGCPHKQPKKLPNGYAAIYIFAYENNGDYEFLKIGKANAKSSARFTSQHYGFNANSTLAKSICEDEKFKAMGITNENVKAWILQNLHRYNIYIKTNCGKATTELTEALFHYRFRPRFEGNI